jgi:enoyl-CoA hydratase/carnithine racemase
MTDSHLGIATENYVTTVTINRPEKRNALTYALLRDLQALMPQLADAREGLQAFLQKRPPQYTGT